MILKYLYKIGLMVIMVGIILSSTALAAGKASAPGQPGSVDDPIVTKSYVDQAKAEIFQELQTQLDEKINQQIQQVLEEKEEQEEPEEPDTPETASLVVEELQPGESIIGYTGTEFIVRTGNVVAIKGENGDGIPDLTGGQDIPGEASVPLNHHLLIPRDDGRGLHVKEGQSSFVMIIGKYTIPGR